MVGVEFLTRYDRTRLMMLWPISVCFFFKFCTGAKYRGQISSSEVSPLNCALSGVAENSAGAISCYDVARSFVDCMLSEKLPTPEALDWAYIVVRTNSSNLQPLFWTAMQFR